MIDFVKNKKEYENYNRKFLNIFKENTPFERNPFNTRFNYFLGFDFDFVYDELFFTGIKSFLSKIKDEKLIFYTINPHPEEYFYKHFGKFSVFEIGINNTDEDLNKIMTTNPGDSPADSLAINSNDIAWFSNSDDWGIICSRDWEISIVGFTNKKILDLFISSFANVDSMFFKFNNNTKNSDLLDICYQDRKPERP